MVRESLCGAGTLRHARVEEQGERHWAYVQGCLGGFVRSLSTHRFLFWKSIPRNPLYQVSRSKAGLVLVVFIPVIAEVLNVIHVRPLVCAELFEGVGGCESS